MFFFSSSFFLVRKEGDKIFICITDLKYFVNARSSPKARSQGAAERVMAATKDQVRLLL